MCAEWRQIWWSLIWLGLRRGFSAGHKESIILLLLLYLLLRGTDIWRGRLWDGAERRERRREQRWKWNTERETRQTPRSLRQTQKLSGRLNADPDTPVLIWKLFYRARLMLWYVFNQLFGVRSKWWFPISTQDFFSVPLFLVLSLLFSLYPNFYSLLGWNCVFFKYIFRVFCRWHFFCILAIY